MPPKRRNPEIPRTTEAELQMIARIEKGITNDCCGDQLPQQHSGKRPDRNRIGHAERVTFPMSAAEKPRKSKIRPGMKKAGRPYALEKDARKWR
jgi:hypothetical protein